MPLTFTTVPTAASGPNATRALKLPSAPSSDALMMPSVFKSSGTVIAPSKFAGVVSTVTVTSVGLLMLPCASTACAWMVIGPSATTGITAVI